MFADNPFKVSIISTKIPDGGCTTAYRCGPLIDLCMGPHVPGLTPPTVPRPRSHSQLCVRVFHSQTRAASRHSKC